MIQSTGNKWQSPNWRSLSRRGNTFWCLIHHSPVVQTYWWADLWIARPTIGVTIRNPTRDLRSSWRRSYQEHDIPKWTSDVVQII